MIERLFLTLILLFGLLAVYWVFRRRHLRLASQVNRTNSSMASLTPTVLYFRSDDCAPCVTQARYLQDLTQRYNGTIAVQKIDADIDRATAERYGVFTLPTTLIIDDRGEVKYINYGLTATQKLSHQLEKIL